MCDNPHLGPEFKERLAESLPEDHPALEPSTLTLVQKFALPILLWFFDSNRGIGSGRTELMAHVLINLAIRGRKVYIVDCSRVPYGGLNNHREIRGVMAERVAILLKKHYSRYNIHYSVSEGALTFTGIRPR